MAIFVLFNLDPALAEGGSGSGAGGGATTIPQLVAWVSKLEIIITQETLARLELEERVNTLEAELATAKAQATKEAWKLNTLRVANAALTERINVLEPLVEFHEYAITGPILWAVSSLQEWRDYEVKPFLESVSSFITSSDYDGDGEADFTFLHGTVIFDTPFGVEMSDLPGDMIFYDDLAADVEATYDVSMCIQEQLDICSVD